MRKDFEDDEDGDKSEEDDVDGISVQCCRPHYLSIHLCTVMQTPMLIHLSMYSAADPHAYPSIYVQCCRPQLLIHLSRYSTADPHYLSIYLGTVMQTPITYPSI